MEEDDNLFRYYAEYFDKETGNIYLRARYYVPSLGRFITEDPVNDGLNWYTYCNNNLITFTDAYGLFPKFDSSLPYHPWNKLPHFKKSSSIPFIKNTLDSPIRPDTPLYNYHMNLLASITDIDFNFSGLDVFGDIFLNNIGTYMQISEKAGLPVELIAAIHFREASGDFTKYLHNGDPLGQPTKNVPSGIYFDNFIDAAVDALSSKSDFINKYMLTSDVTRHNNELNLFFTGNYSVYYDSKQKVIDLGAAYINYQ